MIKNRTLIDDLFQVWCSLSCETIDNSFYYHCENCENGKICVMVEDLIKSIEKFY